MKTEKEKRQRKVTRDTCTKETLKRCMALKRFWLRQWLGPRPLTRRACFLPRYRARSARVSRQCSLTLPGAHQNIIRVFDSVTAATLIHSLERRPPTSLIIYAKMKIESAALFLALAASATAFAPSGMSAVRSNSVSLNILKDEVEKSELDKALGREVRIIRTKSGGFIRPRHLSRIGVSGHLFDWSLPDE